MHTHHYTLGTWANKTQALHQVPCILAGGAGRGHESHAKCRGGGRPPPAVARRPRWAGQRGGAGRGAGGRCWQRARRWRAGLCREASQRGRAAPPPRPASRRPRSVRHTRGSAGARTGAPAFLRPAWVLSCLHRGSGKQPQQVPAQDGVSQLHGENHVFAQPWLRTSHALGS